ncbi:MAG: hypothetical protein H7249_05090 [Chitinophagaceae bacterium]|nr:hypothetical protein [Oligoflexus sp.]
MLWAYDGMQIHVIGTDGKWTPLRLPAALDPALSRIALYFDSAAKTPVVLSMVTLNNAGHYETVCRRVP